MNLESVKNLCKMITDTYQIGVYFYDTEGDLVFTVVDRTEQLINSKIFGMDQFSWQCIFRKDVRVYINEYSMTWIGIPVLSAEIIRGAIIIGPVFSKRMLSQTLKGVSEKNGFEGEQANSILNYIMELQVYSYSEYIQLIKVIYFHLYNKEFDESDLKSSNEQIEANMQLQEYHSDQIDVNKMEFHGTYQLEQSIMECIRTGHVDTLMRIALNQEYGNPGNLSDGNELRQEKNIFIVITTLATRAAIEGGLNSEIAYSVSDMYIQQAEALKSIRKIQDLSLQMLLDFTGRVNQHNGNKSYSVTICKACEYISAHIYDDINLSDLACYLQVSNGHLSRLFNNETEKSIVDYIKEVRINEAKFLLKYSNYSIAEISAKLQFSTQSYFSNVFKEITGLTPKQFKGLE